jgi:ATP-dependent exoDNAse (exonuclease V) alpha subunit
LYSADTVGDIDPNSFTTPQELVLKVGAHVMFTRNDPNQRWVNGSLGLVTYCGKDSVTVKMRDGETQIVEATKWESTKYRLDENTQSLMPTVAGTFTQIPLTLAWALTIHKAQGQTLPTCVIDLSDGGTFAEGQLYVALSRARSLDSIHLTTPIQARHIKTNPAVLAFYRDLGR